MSVARGFLVALAVWTGAMAPSARAASEGPARLTPERDAASEGRNSEEPAELAGGSFPGAIGWVALGLGIALVIVLVGLGNAETVSE